MLKNISEFLQCRKSGIDFNGGDQYINRTIISETKCLEMCLGFETCIAITLVGQNLAKYSDAAMGCHMKDREYVVVEDERTSKMVSYDVECVRSKYSKYIDNKLYLCQCV